MRVCESCGKELSNQESFCGYCDGTPQMTAGPFVPNPVPGEYPSSAFHSSPTISVPRYAPPSAPPYAPGRSPTTHGYPPHRPPLPYHPLSLYQTAPGGCAPPWLIFLFAAIIIISIMIGFGLTVLSRPGQMPTTSSSRAASLPVTSSATSSGLSCINPTSITLGPVSEGYTQAFSSQVSLCMTGSGTVKWAASWDQNQASWLQLDYSTGDIQAPGQQQINVSALAAKLKPGSYTAPVTFSSQQSSATETLNVTFIVQAGCIHTSQQEYSFTGIAGVSDPQVQTLMVSNCGTAGSWSTTISTNNNVNWLSVAPTSAGLIAGATQSVTISASNLKAQLPAGIYGGKIQFSIGSNQVMVYVTLTVEPGSKIILVSPGSGSFNANQDCTFNLNLVAWICTVTISNSSNTLSLTWKSSSSGVSNITFKPSAGTMTPGAEEQVEIIVPKINCQTPTTLTFTGPANAVYISWSCSIIP